MFCVYAVFFIGYFRLTFGLANLNTTTAVETTNEIRPNVSAFHAFNAINANANGNKTVVLNFSPNKNGTKTFLTSPRPVWNKSSRMKNGSIFFLLVQFPFNSILSICYH